jgi:hypothetical protein
MLQILNTNNFIGLYNIQYFFGPQVRNCNIENTLKK